MVRKKQLLNSKSLVHFEFTTTQIEIFKLVLHLFLNVFFFNLLT